MERLRVGVLDIETMPILAYVWERHDQNIAINQIKTDWRLAAFTFKWLGGQQIVYRDARQEADEKALLLAIWKLLDTCDVLITQNGKAFDVKKLNARFILHGMKPPSPYKHLDTYLIARAAGTFTAHSLDYLTEKLCTKYKKLKHSDFPGMMLWTECMKGNPKAWAAMKKYNIHDVLATEELYEKLKAWAPKNAPAVFATDDSCATCGGRLAKSGTRPIKGGRVTRFYCTKCGRWTQERLKKAA